MSFLELGLCVEDEKERDRQSNDFLPHLGSWPRAFRGKIEKQKKKRGIKKRYNPPTSSQFKKP